MADTPSARLLRSLLVVCACILVVASLARVVLIPLVLAVLLAFLLVPAVARFSAGEAAPINNTKQRDNILASCPPIRTMSSVGFERSSHP